MKSKKIFPIFNMGFFEKLEIIMSSFSENVTPSFSENVTPS